MKSNKPIPEKETIAKKPLEQKLSNEILDTVIGLVVIVIIAGTLIWVVGLLI
ncbi:MAG: hypothetical protein ACHQFW_12010 [Chitinophagales bacterium]